MIGSFFNKYDILACVKRHLFIIWVTYAFLVLVTSVLLQEMSPRHTLFVLISIIIADCSASLYADKKQYIVGIGILLALFWSLFIVRANISNVTRIWHVYTYMAFSFSISNFLFLVLSSFKFKIAKYPVLLLALISVFIPIATVWEYFFISGTWIGAADVVAVLQTNTAEAFSYITNMLPIYGYFFFVFVVAFIYALSKIYINLGFEKSWNIKRGIGTCLLLILCIVLSVRTKDNFLFNIYTESRNSIALLNQFKDGLKQRQNNISNLEVIKSGHKGIFVLVIGESATKDHMSVYGYQRSTTPWIEKMEQSGKAILFKNAYSCYPQTVQSLTYALSAKNQYNNLKLENAVSLVEAAKAAGYKTVWVSNQVRYGHWDTPITTIGSVADQQIWLNSRIDTIDSDVYDGNLVNSLKDIEYSDKTLIIFHLMGSHLSYVDRYPQEFAIYNNSISREQGYIDEYDNSIAYTDYVIGKIWDDVSNRKDFQGLVYFSDHGEAVDEKLSHSHTRFRFSMVRIPVALFLSEQYKSNFNEIYSALMSHRNSIFTNDLVYNMMTGIMNIRCNDGTNIYNDISSKEYDSSSERFTTMYGAKRIIDDKK